ncbi:MAG: hypothetical protein GSR78_04810 [Desulfurococcales archaeon]|nr:hypothetical protein [Desulfurococcales archaeon]
MIRRVPAALIPILALALVALLLAPIAIAEEVNLTVKPDAPKPIKNIAVKFLSLLLFLVLIAGIASLVAIVFKFMSGENWVKYLLIALAAITIVYGLNEIIAWLSGS